MHISAFSTLFVLGGALFAPQAHGAQPSSAPAQLPASSAHKTETAPTATRAPKRPAATTQAASRPQRQVKIPALAESAAPPHPIKVTFEPAAVVMRPDALAIVRLDADGATLGVSDVRLHVNVGTVDSLQVESDGRLSAAYSPPVEPHPQIAIVVARARVDGSDYFGWASLPLAAKRTVQVKGAPGQELLLHVGGQTFGPVIANDKGRAKVQAVIPPGYRYGRVGEQRVKLGIRSFSRIFLVALSDRVDNGPDDGLPVYILVVTTRGQPDRRPSVRLRSDRGRVTRPVLVEPGLLTARFSGAKLAPDTVATLKVQLSKSSRSQSSCAVLITQRPAPASLPASAPAEPIVQKEVNPLWWVAGAGGGLFVLAGLSAAALDATLSSSDLGDGETRMRMLTTERVLAGLAIVGLVTGAIGTGIAIASEDEP